MLYSRQLHVELNIAFFFLVCRISANLKAQKYSIIWKRNNEFKKHGIDEGEVEVIIIFLDS